MIFSTLPSQQPFTYTWATKPPAAGNAGLRVRISDLRNKEFESDGAYWRPASGIATICLADLSAYTTTSTTLAALTISTADLPLLPLADLMAVPGMRITTRLNAYRSSMQSAQGPILWAQWADVNNATFARTNPAASATNGLLSASGESVMSPGQGSAPTGAPWGSQAYFNGLTSGPVQASVPAGMIQPIIKAQTGGAGETIRLGSLEMVYSA